MVSALSTQSQDLHCVISDYKIKFASDFFLTPFNNFIYKLNNSSTLDTDQVIVMFFASYFISFSRFAEGDGFGKSFLFEKSESTIDSSDAYPQIG